MFTKLNEVIRGFAILLIFINIGISKAEKNPLLRFQDVVEQNAPFQKAADVCLRRIAGGHVVPAQYVPYLVTIRQIYKEYWITYCGGCLVTYTYVLTAAHCFCGVDGKIIKALESLRIVAGSERTISDKFQVLFEQSRQLKDFWRHMEYRLDEYEHDIGVVEVQSRFFPTPSVRPVPMMKKDVEADVQDWKSCVIAGHGLLENDIMNTKLRLVCLPLLSYDACKYYYGDRAKEDFIVCAGEKGKDSCVGDSGGPLVCDGVQVGIMTYGSTCGLYPGFYTRLAGYTDDLNLRFMNGASGDSGGALVCGVVHVGILSYGGPCGAYPAIYAKVGWILMAIYILTEEVG